MRESKSTTGSRIHIWVNGRVHGVGFRAHVLDTANALGLTGWVRNVGWDQVETVAEGPRRALERFSNAVKAGPRAALVEKARVKWERFSGEFRYFEVRRSQ